MNRSKSFKGRGLFQQVYHIFFRPADTCPLFSRQTAYDRADGIFLSSAAHAIVRVPSGSSEQYIRSVLAFLRGKRFDIIQVDNRPFYMARVKQACPGTPVALFLHSLSFVPTTPGVAACFAKADLIIANSESLKQNLGRKFPKQVRKIRVVHLGVDVNRFKPPNPTQKTVGPGQTGGAAPIQLGPNRE